MMVLSATDNYDGEINNPIKSMGENEMGTFMLYLIVICLLVMVYVLFDIRSQLGRLRISLERHLDGSRDSFD